VDLKQSEHSFEIHTLQVVFLVLQEKLSNFKISNMSGQGLLSSLTGWEKGKEMSSARIVGIKGWDK